MDRIAARKILLEIGQLLDTMGLPFFLTYGTCLGAYRDNGFTPDEKDIDIGFFTEHFLPRASELATRLVESGYQIQTISKPFTRCRAIKANKEDINVDLVSFTKWANQDTGFNGRFSASYRAEFSMVYPKPMLEKWERVNLFDRGWNVPSPVEKYLESEYGPDWKTPRHDFMQRTRVKKFRALEGIPNDLLEGDTYV